MSTPRTFFPWSRPWRRALVVILPPSFWSVLSAATPVAVPTPAEVLTLSPFVVEADSDIGYSASQSTMGGRFKQKIKDIPSQIEVITPEFMRDFAITSLEDAFRYSVNVENLEEYVSPPGRWRGLLEREGSRADPRDPALQLFHVTQPV